MKKWVNIYNEYVSSPIYRTFIYNVNINSINHIILKLVETSKKLIFLFYKYLKYEI